MGILAKVGLRKYQDTWSVVSKTPFGQDDIESITSIEVVASQWGISCKLTFLDGDVSFLPISQEAREVCIGDTIEPSECSLVILKRGDKTCEKIVF